MKSYNIVFTTDNQYIKHLSVAMISLIENNKNIELNIFILYNDIDLINLKKIESVAEKYKCNVTFIEINDTLFDDLVIGSHFSKANYYRLLIPDVVFESKVLYLDVDVIVNGSIESLFDFEIDNFYVGAVENPSTTRQKELGMSLDSKYFNSGVLLINMDYWRSNNLKNRVVEFTKSNSEKILLVDQDGLNSIIDGNWKNIPLKYNQQSCIFEKDFDLKNNCFSTLELKEARETPIIIHYTGSLKPWHFRSNHPYKNLYWKYFRMSPFYHYFSEDFTFRNVISMMIPKTIKNSIKKLSP